MADERDREVPVPTTIPTRFEKVNSELDEAEQRLARVRSELAAIQAEVRVMTADLHRKKKP